MPFSDADATRKLRIVHVFRAPLGGLFRHVVDLAREQSARGHAVGMFFDSSVTAPSVDAALSTIPKLALGIRRRAITRNPSHRDIAGIAACNDHLAKVGADVAHGHGSKGGLYARAPGLLNPAAGPIRAYTPHGGSFNYAPGSGLHRVYMGVERILARATDVLLFESGYIAARYDAFVGKVDVRRAIVFNGLSDTEFQAARPNPDAADILYVGELRAAKGVDTLLHALSILKSRTGATTTACLVGSGPDVPMLRTMANALDLGGDVTFPGPMPVREAFKLGRILVVPSRAESLPYVVLEAAAARVPMVATNVGGIPEIFGPFAGQLGPCDDPASLAERLQGALAASRDTLADETADLALYVGARFSVQRMADSVIAGYHEAAAARRARSAKPEPAFRKAG